MNRIGIMQGRLSHPEAGRIQAFPRGSWEEEFRRARSAGLATIEWIYDHHGEDVNPIGTDAGIGRLKGLEEETGVAVASVCADYFLEAPLLRCGREDRRQLVERLFWLMERCRALRIERIVLPFVDASAINSEAEQGELAPLLRDAASCAEKSGMELHLETSLGPSQFAGFLHLLDHPAVRVNYDSGNSASLGFDPREEFEAYGELVGSVHIKDRLLHGGTVALGSGDADFEAVFACLRQRKYRGDFILQAARGSPGEEVELSRRNREFVLRGAGEVP
jgi:hexulose-6-phosphate isomerase